MAGALNITAHFGAGAVPRAEVLAWEARRAARVAKRLGMSSMPADLVTLRRAIVERKLALGHDAIEKMLATDLWVSERVARFGAAVAGGRRSLCTIELSADRGSAEIISPWYERAITSGNEAPLLAACPDHYISRVRGDGLQEVIETTGGAPMAIRMLFDASDLSTLTSKPDPAFRTEWAGIARAPDGTAIGGIRHQFHDSSAGFRARLTVEFPWATLGYMIREHQWHLACEFSNWIEAANAES